MWGWCHYEEAEWERGKYAMAEIFKQGIYHNTSMFSLKIAELKL